MPPAPSLLVMAKRPTVVPVRASAAASAGAAGGGVLTWSAIDKVPAGFRNSNLSRKRLPKRLLKLCRGRQGRAAKKESQVWESGGSQPGLSSTSAPVVTHDYTTPML